MIQNATLITYAFIVIITICEEKNFMIKKILEINSVTSKTLFGNNFCQVKTFFLGQSTLSARFLIYSHSLVIPSTMHLQ